MIKFFKKLFHDIKEGYKEDDKTCKRYPAFVVFNFVLALIFGFVIFACGLFVGKHGCERPKTISASAEDVVNNEGGTIYPPFNPFDSWVVTLDCLSGAVFTDTFVNVTQIQFNFVGDYSVNVSTFANGVGLSSVSLPLIMNTGENPIVYLHSRSVTATNTIKDVSMSLMYIGGPTNYPGLLLSQCYFQNYVFIKTSSGDYKIDFYFISIQNPAYYTVYSIYCHFSQEIYYLPSISLETVPDSYTSSSSYYAGYFTGFDRSTYANAYTEGFNVGYDLGVEDTSKDVQSGYDNGYNAGYDVGYNVGYKDGDIIGYQRGLNVAENGTFVNAVSTVLGAPVTVVQEFLDFNILGYNMLAFVMGLITLLILVKVIKLFI